MSQVLYDSQTWLGVPNFNRAELAKWDPHYTGYNQIFVIRTPPVLDAYDKAYGTNHGKNFTAIMERLSTSFTGIPERTLESVNQTHGFQDRIMPHPTVPSLAFDTGNIRLMEYKERPVHSMIEVWLDMAGGDVVSKAKDYRGLAATIPGGYSIANHTASFILATSSPDFTKIIRAYYITAAFPTGLSNEMFNWNAGEINIVEGIDLAVKGVIRWGKGIEQRAQELLDQRMRVINFYAGDRPDGKPYMTQGGNVNGDTIAPQNSMI